MSTEHENQSNEEKNGLDRRNFLKLGLAGAAAVAAAATGVTTGRLRSRSISLRAVGVRSLSG